MRRNLLFLAVLCGVLFAVGPAMAGLDLPLQDLGAGPAIVMPWSDEEPTYGALDITVKFLPIKEPDSLSIGTLPQYVGANLGADILFRGINADDADLGGSLPVYSNGTKVPIRVGTAYVKGTGGAWFVKAEYNPEPVADALDGSIVLPDEQYGVALGPGAVMATYTLRF